MQANSSEVPAACEIKLIRDFPPLIYWLQSPQSALTRPPAVGAKPFSIYLATSLVGGRGSHHVGPNCGSKWKCTQDWGQGRVHWSDPVGKGELTPRGFRWRAPPAGPQGALSQERRGGTCRRPALSRAPTRVWAVVEVRWLTLSLRELRAGWGLQGASWGRRPPAVIYLFGAAARAGAVRPWQSRPPPACGGLHPRPACCGVWASLWLDGCSGAVIFGSPAIAPGDFC